MSATLRLWEVNGIVLLLFVEYHNAFREAASAMIDREEDLRVASQAGSVAEDLVRELHEANPSVRC